MNQDRATETIVQSLQRQPLPSNKMISLKAFKINMSLSQIKDQSHVKNPHGQWRTGNQLR